MERKMVVCDAVDIGIIVAMIGYLTVAALRMHFLEAVEGIALTAADLAGALIALTDSTDLIGATDVDVMAGDLTAVIISIGLIAVVAAADAAGSSRQP